jgi:hypothetical protein
MIMQGDRKRMVTAILGPSSKNVGKRSPEGAPDEHTATGHQLMQEFSEAVHTKDHAGAWEALKTAFHHMESEPHAEGEHTSEE